ncbi:MAG: homogentisate 1,2-dioxygenase domain-containing protein [Bradymonadaceae bacterium]
MDYVPKMTELTPTNRELHPAHREELDGWHSSGRPPQGYYSYKLDFGAEILRESPPTILEGSQMYLDRGDFRETVEEAPPRETGALRRRAIDMTAVEGDFFAPVLWSQDVAVWAGNGEIGSDEYWTAYRHGDCHELLFVHATEESFDVVTDFGVLDGVGTGDFVHLPRGTTYAFVGGGEATVLAYEVPSPIMRPYDYWMGDQQPWPYPPEAPEPPEPAGTDPLAGDRDPIREVVVKRRTGDYTKLSYETPVFDAVAWEGQTWPFTINLEDFNTLTSPDFHVDPPKVTSFVSEDEGMYLQTFLPRWMQSPPYNHMNSVDEALLNHHGYEARPQITDGYLTLHPSGVPHGPDPLVVEELAEQEPPDKKDLPWASEIGVMVESATPFSVLEAGREAEFEGYDESWSDTAAEEGLI